MKTWNRGGLCITLGLFMLAFPASAQSTPAQVLEQKGLTKQGIFYVLPAEADVIAAAREMRTLKLKMENEVKDRRKIEEQIARVKSAIAHMEFERKRCESQLRMGGNTPAVHNNLVRQLNEMNLELEQAMKFKAEQETQLRTLGEASRNAYISLVVQSNDKIDKATTDYQALAADDEVKSALAKLSEKGSIRFKLGPTADYTQAAAAVRRAKADVASSTIRVKNEGNVHMVDVNLNNKITRQMVVDSGASVIVLPAEMADDLGMVPTDADPTVRMQQADGKVIEGKKMTLKSVRVGVFTVEEVECVVMPKTAITVQPLLGGSFLNNFVYRLDPEAGELHLAQVPGSNKRISTTVKPGTTETPRTPSTPPSRQPAPRTGAGDPPAKPPIGAGDIGYDERGTTAGDKKPVKPADDPSNPLWGDDAQKPGTPGKKPIPGATPGDSSPAGGDPKPTTPAKKPPVGSGNLWDEHGNVPAKKEDKPLPRSEVKPDDKKPTDLAEEFKKTSPILNDPVKRPPKLSPEEMAKRTLEFLEKEYKRKLESPDWRVRALAVVSLARLPQPEITAKLLQIAENDKHDMPRLIAWQAVLARLPEANEATYKKFYNATLSIGDMGAFRGRMRVTALQVLATSPMNSRARKIFEKMFIDANAWESQDIPTLKALGMCLNAWRSGTLCKWIIEAMRNESVAYRAEFVLQNAGCPIQSAKSRLGPSAMNPTAPDRTHVSSGTMWQMAYTDYSRWLQQDARNWKEVQKIDGEPWKELRPLYISAPVPMDEAMSNPDIWRADLELGNANIKAFEVAFVVDATGSMGDVIEWLGRDIAKVAMALSTLSLEPRLGLTFYRDAGDPGFGGTVKHGTLIGKIQPLVQFIQSMTAEGGGDIPEAVYDGLKEAYANNRWNTRQEGGKAIVLIGDAPPHPQDVEKTVELAAEARKKGFRVYAVKTVTAEGRNDLSTFDRIAEAGGGPAIDAVFPRLSRTKFIDGVTRKEIPIKTMERPEAQTIIAPPPVNDHPGEKILSMVLSDVINPKYRDRLDPLVRTLLSYCEPTSPQEVRRPFPDNTPPLGTTKFNPQD